MDANAIRSVSAALETILERAIRGNVYVGPLDDPGASSASAVLFLYRVSVNADLRNSSHSVLGTTGSTIVYDGSLPLDLHYLLTAGTLQTGGELEALGVLGVAMQALNDAPYLVGVPVQGETVRVSLDPITSEEMSRIWTLFPTVNYRTSVAYLASPVWIDPAVTHEPAGPVVHEQYRVGHAGPAEP